MTYTFPLSVEALASKLRIRSVSWDVARFDEYSGQGSGHDLQAELAPPKWTADLALAPQRPDDAKQVAAIIRKLQGSQNPFMLCDPNSLFPQVDPDGVLLGAAAVTVQAIGANRQSIQLKGLPAGYVLTLGDKVQVNFAAGARTYFFEVSETVAASAGGVTPAFEIWPRIPVGVVVDLPAILKKPACKMVLQPKGFGAGRSDQISADGVTIKAIERK